MSFRKKGRKFRPDSGKVFPRSSGKVEKSDAYDFAAVVSTTLREAFGGGGRSVKTVMAYTGAGERTVKNWFEGKNAPNGENLVMLARHSDEVLEALLLMAGREEILTAKYLIDARDRLAEILKLIDEVLADQTEGDPTREMGSD